jgi:hypothetical protein
MDKHELVELTIERLLANFEKSPESFDLKSADFGNWATPTVTWKPRVQLGSYDSSIVDDPNNNYAVVIVYNVNTETLSCHLFLKTYSSLDSAKADLSISSNQSFMKFRSRYRKFEKLMNLIKERDLRRDNMNYLSKLSAVFPDTLDSHILKD